MMRFFTRFSLFSLIIISLLPKLATSQVTLASSPYTENFDNIGSGLPNGFSIYAAATGTTLGTAATLTTAATAWNNTSGAFKNFASGNIGASGTQATATDRALGVRQTGAVGDPGAAFVFQALNTTGKTGFKLAFKLQSLDATSPRTTTWRVDYGFGSNPTSYTVVPAGSITGTFTTGGSVFGNYANTIDFGSALDNQSQVVTIRITTQTASTGGGNRPSSGIDDFSLSWGSGTSLTPTITLNNNGATAIQFPSTGTGSSSAAQTYTVNAANLMAPLSVSTTAPFKVSLDGTNFATSLSVAPDVNGTIATTTIYTNFSPTVSGVVSGTITNSSGTATAKNIMLSGEGIDPNNLTFNFNTCTNLGVPGSGFYAYNVVGPQVWNCTTFGTNGTNAVNINGYSGTAINNEDWLISPILKIASLTTPVLSFNSRGEFSGPILQLLASTNYDGFSNPDSSGFAWTPLNGNFLVPPGGANSVFNFSDNINLSSYKSASKLYIAFKYVSDTIQGAARWTLDDVTVSDRSTLFSVSPTVLSYNETTVGTNAVGQAIALQSLGHKDITVMAPAEFQVSLNNITYSTSIIIDSVTAKTGTTIYARFSPTIKAIKETGLLHFTGLGLDTSFVALSGSSYPKSETLDIACYNLSFFGSNSNNNATPASTNLKKANIETVFNHLNADIIGVEEISSDSVFFKMVSELPGYAGILSPKWSYFFQPFNESTDIGYPPQKVGFIYNTNTVKLIDSHVIDGAQYDSVRAGTKTAWTDYPTGDRTSFYSSGRLPFLATFDVTIGGITKRIKAVDIHAKAAGDATSYARRVYDAKVLKDTLDRYYPNDNVITVGDYNDRLVSSIYLGSTVSPYAPYVADPADYKALTYSLDSAGKSSFPGDVGMIDQLIATNELVPNYIPNSTDIEPANTYISNYGVNTASDHLPVFSRFVLNAITPIAFTGCPNVNIAIARPGYNTYNNEGVNLYTVDTTTGAATLIPGGPLLETNTNKNMDMNGVGFNSNDNFLYGVRDTGTAANAKALLYRIASNYGVQLLGTIAPPSLAVGDNTSAVNPAAGSFDADGNYYFTGVSGIASGAQGVPTNYYIGKLTGLSNMAPGSGILTPTYTKIDFSSTNCATLNVNLLSPITTTGSTAGTGIEDIAYNNAFNSLYFFSAYPSPIGLGIYNGQLVRISPTTGVATCYAAVSPFAAASTKNEVAGISSTVNGSLIIYTTGGDMYKTAKTVSGDFTGTVTKVGTAVISSLGTNGAIRADLASCGLGKPLTQVVNPALPQGVIIAYPNPARGVSTISTTTTLNNATVSLMGLAGNVITQKTGVSGNTFQLNLANMPSGIYMVEINQNGNISRVKIAKE